MHIGPAIPLFKLYLRLGLQYCYNSKTKYNRPPPVIIRTDELAVVQNTAALEDEALRSDSLQGMLFSERRRTRDSTGSSLPRLCLCLGRGGLSFCSKGRHVKNIFFQVLT